MLVSLLAISRVSNDLGRHRTIFSVATNRWLATVVFCDSKLGTQKDLLPLA